RSSTCTSSSPARAPRPRGRRCAPPSCRTCPGRDHARGPSAHAWRRRARRSRGGGKNAPGPARAALPDRGRPRAAAHCAGFHARSGRATLGASVLRGIRRARLGARRGGRLPGIQLFAFGRMGSLRVPALPRRRAAGRPRPGDRRAQGWAGARALRFGRSPGGEAARGTVRGHRRAGRGALLLGARASGAASRLPPSRRVRAGDRLNFGIDRLLEERALQKRLKGRRLALLAHPASVTKGLAHSMDALFAAGLALGAALGPQHGLRGDKQDNMVESPDFTDPVHAIPVFSLYGEVRRPTDAMMQSFDVLLVDLQDLGCRVYTFVTTLRYMLEAAAKHRKEVWILDRPNPAG